MEDQTIAVVTGANRGIGLEIVRQLAARGMRVILASRDVDKGGAAADALRDAGLAVEAMPLDVADPASCHAAHDWLARRFDRIDVLVNNAGILIDRSNMSALDLPIAMLRETLDTNLIGVLQVTQALVPLLKRSRHGRIVNLSSGLGQLSEMGAGTPAYRMSKTALNALTRILAADLAADGIKVNTMCPGWVRTALGGPNATRTVEQGADTAVWLATLPDDGPSGGYFRDRSGIPW